MVNNLRDFLKTFDQANESLQIPLPKPEIEIWSTKSTKLSLLITTKISLNIQRDKFKYLAVSKITNVARFSSIIEKYKLRGNPSILTEVGNRDHRKIFHL